MKKAFQLSIVVVGTIGILATVFHDAFFTDIIHPLLSLRMFKYFTIQSNLLAVIYFWILFSLKLDMKNRLVQKFVGCVTVCITITFLIFSIVLEGLYQESGLLLLGSICMHYINPILVIGYVIYVRKDLLLDNDDIKYWLIYPVLYLVFALILGGITGNPLYPFFDFVTMGVFGISIVIIGLLLLFLALSFGLVKIVSKK